MRDAVKFATDRFDLSFFGIITENNDSEESIRNLETRGFTPHGREDMPLSPWNLPIAWGEDPYGDRNWMFQLHAWRPLDAYFHAMDQQPGQAGKFLSKVLAVINDWIVYNIHGPGCIFSWYDMSTGLRALKLAYLILFARQHSLPFDAVNDWQLMLNLHFRHLSNPEELNAGNHGLFQINGLMALAWAAVDHPEAARYRAYAAEKMQALLRNQLGEYGIHTENSPSYHFFVLSKIQELLRAPWWAGENLERVHALVERGEIAKYWLASPDRRSVPVGDSTSRMAVKNFARLKEWPHVEHGQTMGAILDGYGVVRTQPSVKERTSFLFLQGSFHLRTHKHADCLSFVWQEQDEYILIDSGKYGYRTDAMRKYFLSTRAHNTVEIDHRSYSRRTEDAYGSAIKGVRPFGKGWLLTAGLERPDIKVKHHRAIIFFPGRFVLAIDQLVNHENKERHYTTWWHLNPLHEVINKGERDFQIKGLKDSKEVYGSFRSNCPELAQSVKSARGKADPQPLGWVSTDYLRYEPTTSLGFGVKTAAPIVTGTLFELCGKGKSRKLELISTHGGLVLTGLPEGDSLQAEGACAEFLTFKPTITIGIPTS